MRIKAGKANCFRKDDQGIVWFHNCIVVPKNDEVCQQILDEPHLSRYSIHPGPSGTAGEALGEELDLFKPPPSMNLADERSPTIVSEATKDDKY
jgi:hypothetical protein